MLHYSWAAKLSVVLRSWRPRLLKSTALLNPLVYHSKSVMLLSTCCYALLANSLLQPVTSNQPAEIMLEEDLIPTRMSATTIGWQQLSDSYFTMAYLCRIFQWTLRYTALSLHLTASIMTLPALLLGDLLRKWWWSFLRTNICSAGPSFIKFAQV